MSPGLRVPVCLCPPVQITEPYLQIYRGILPPLFGQLDFTPLFGFLILQVRYIYSKLCQALVASWKSVDPFACKGG